MKTLKIYEKIHQIKENNVFEYFLDSLIKSIKSYDFYVEWEKVIKNVNEIELSLCLLNSLIGKKDVKNGFCILAKQYPEIISVIPILIAVRDPIIDVNTITEISKYDFTKKLEYTENEILHLADFLEKCGLLKIFSDRTIKNIIDYVYGIEVGLDTNARKNRTGKKMEEICEIYIKTLCEKKNFEYISQATAENIQKKWNMTINSVKIDRHFDFAIRTQEKIYLIEVNFYSKGGSKLKAVAGEFITLYNQVKALKVGFIWITDGEAWKTTFKSLKETFDSTDFILNLSLIEQGALEEILSENK